MRTTTHRRSTPSRRRLASGRPSIPGRPAKLQLLARGLGVVGSYAKVLLADEVPAVYAQFGPLSAYPGPSAPATSTRPCPTRRSPP